MYHALLHFSFSGLYSVQMWKIRTRRSPNTDTFHAVLKIILGERTWLNVEDMIKNINNSSFKISSKHINKVQKEKKKVS